MTLIGHLKRQGLNHLPRRVKPRFRVEPVRLYIDRLVPDSGESEFLGLIHEAFGVVFVVELKEDHAGRKGCDALVRFDGILKVGAAIQTRISCLHRVIQ